MLLVFVCLFAAAAAGPVSYDQRQDGEFNARVDISNLLFLFAIPQKMSNNIYEAFSKSKPVDSEHVQDRADVRVVGMFMKPTKPYHVEIGEDGRSEESDGRVAEVVIAGRRRLESDQIDSQEQDDELKLLGATENCGPDRVRDSVTLMCKDIEPVKVDAAPEPEKKENSEIQSTPEVVPS